LNKGRRPISIQHAVDAVTVGEYQCFAGGLAAADDPRPSVTADALLDDGMRAAIEARFAMRFETFDARAVHSIWMKWYLNTFLPPVLLADVLLARKLPLALAQTRFIIADDSRISAVVISDEAEDTSGLDPFVRFESLIFGHFEPLIGIWSARTDVTSRVYWSNVGNTFEAMLRRIELVSGPSPRLQQAQRLLSEANWPDGRPNPLFDAVHYVMAGDAPERRRRVCCLQYLLPDRCFCKACPIEEARLPVITAASV
jgi:ferric iron reductase protein FhuF